MEMDDGDWDRKNNLVVLIESNPHINGSAESGDRRQDFGAELYAVKRSLQGTALLKREFGKSEQRWYFSFVNQTCLLYRPHELFRDVCVCSTEHGGDGNASSARYATCLFRGHSKLGCDFFGIARRGPSRRHDVNDVVQKISILLLLDPRKNCISLGQRRTNTGREIREGLCNWLVRFGYVEVKYRHVRMAEAYCMSRTR